MKIHEIQSHLRSLNGGWMDLEKTVDTFKSGDPKAEVTGIAVGWMSYTWALRRALEQGCNVFVTHEPTYYNHLDNDPEMLRFASVRAKREFIEESGIAILRCHDLWDQQPGIGIPDSWGTFLGLGKAVAGQGYFRVYEVDGRSVGELARQVAAKTEALGQPAVQVIGDAEKRAGRACIGTGAITPFLKLVEDYAVDLAICTDDGISYWRDGAFAIDAGIPMIVVNHQVSEEAGMVNLAEHLRAAFPAVPVHHIAQRCMYTLVSS